jgi:hypothetical protein
VTKLVIESNLSCIVVASHQYLRQDKIPPLMSGNVAFVTDNGLSFYNQIFFFKRFLNNYIHTRQNIIQKLTIERMSWKLISKLVLAAQSYSRLSWGKVVSV